MHCTQLGVRSKTDVKVSKDEKTAGSGINQILDVFPHGIDGSNGDGRGYFGTSRDTGDNRITNVIAPEPYEVQCVRAGSLVNWVASGANDLGLEVLMDITFNSLVAAMTYLLPATPL